MGTRILLSMVLIAICRPDARGQYLEAENNNVTSGTLNLILANKNGFVVAADSRASSSAPFHCTDHKKARKAPGTQIFYCDDSQKLFRTGERSTMVMAGFAVAQRGTPLDLVVASVLRKRFGPGGNTMLDWDSATGKFQIRNGSEPGVPKGPEGVVLDSMWCRGRLGQALTAIASLYDPSSLPPEKMVFVATFVAIDATGNVVLRHQTF